MHIKGISSRSEGYVRTQKENNYITIEMNEKNIGLFEIIARETLVLIPLGIIDRSIAAGYAAVVHATLLIPIIVVGQIILWWDNISLNRLWIMGKNNKEDMD